MAKKVKNQENDRHRQVQFGLTIAGQASAAIQPVRQGHNFLRFNRINIMLWIKSKKKKRKRP